MKNLRNLFHASPEACFEEIEAVLTSLQNSTDSVVRRVDALAELYEEYLKTTFPLLAVPPMTNWVYDARMANVYFDSIYDPEIYADFAKVWVNGTGLLATRLAMPRSRQHRFDIEVRDFACDAAEQSFRLLVDGLHCPWVSGEGRAYSTIIPEKPGTPTLDFTVACDAQETTADISFSFSAIRISAI